MIRALLTCAALAVGLSGCASHGSAPSASPIDRADVFSLGDHYESVLGGSLFVISVQDEFRLIRCIPSGPIAGCYEDVWRLPREGVRYNRWMPVDSVPGLEIAVVSPTEVAYREKPRAGTPR
jgi:hypothetical protein